MRRSAAPSQLHKRLPGQFRPPFLSPPAKRPCVSQPDSGIQSTSIVLPQPQAKINTAENIPTRSNDDILVLLKNPSLESHPTESSPTTENANEAIRNEADVKTYNNVNENVLSSNAQNCLPLSIGNEVSLSKSGVKQVTKIYPQKEIENQEPEGTKYYSVVWCKRSNKKHKKWEGDAILIGKGRSVTLKDTEGKVIGRGSGYKLSDLAQLEDGSTLFVGGKEIEIQGVISSENYSSGRCFQGSDGSVDVTPTKILGPSFPKPKPFRLPTLNKLATANPSSRGVSASPLYDHTSPNALVMPRPPSQHQWRYNKHNSPVVDVVVDPEIGKHLRSHQIEGVLFLYECVMGFKSQDSSGAILADEMGLGKTLQCIALVWTLLKQGPYGRSPVVKRVLIVTPSSIAANWGKEFKKWLRREKLDVYIVDQHNKVEQYSGCHNKPVMIISYEMFLRSADIIESLNFDLLLCDEGHRLKNGAIKTTSLLANLSCRRRVILTGTPVQNDLKELHALADFVNPGVFGSPASFRHVYEDPIIASQQPAASEEEKDLGMSRASQLNRMTSLFTLRRTQEIIKRYLPPKVEYVVFCQPSETQLAVYDAFIGCRSFRQVFNTMDNNDPLSAICTLRKLCNHPALLAQAGHEEGSSSAVASEVTNLLPEHIEPKKYDETDSGKLAVVSCILWALAENGNEKIVLVSNYTSALDMLAQLCERYSYSYIRLDGSTPTAKRQTLVDQFNDPFSVAKVFLLSAKAGGVGLNLIGASRILLFDIDWNPATDLQAMSRVWRDGQKRKVYIYRLLMTGSVEEKIYQRQVKKQRLSGAVVDARDSEKVHFSTEELKDLFTLHSDTHCLTHDLMKCSCDLSGNMSNMETISKVAQPDRTCQLGGSSNVVSNLSTRTMDQLHDWCHIQQPFNQDVVKDHCLEAASDFITFIFRNESSHKEV